jgi:hypothetical protein
MRLQPPQAKHWPSDRGKKISVEYATAPPARQMSTSVNAKTAFLIIATSRMTAYRRLFSWACAGKM